MNILVHEKRIDAPEAGETTDLSGLLRGMPGIPLGGLEGVRLMNRFDTKYILPAFLLKEVFERVGKEYYILEIDERRIASYETVYYDWPSGRFFLDHVNGKLNRNKVRIRKYTESNLEFLEVKRKTNTQRTRKFRISLDSGEEVFDERGLAFLGNYISGDLRQLQPVMINRFKRITLVNREKSERVTMDVDLSYSDIEGKREIFLPRLSIIEIKQEKSSTSAMKNVLLDLRIKSRGISKYCLGISLLGLADKTNNYKRKIRFIQKITQHGITS